MKTMNVSQVVGAFAVAVVLTFGVLIYTQLGHLIQK